MRQIHDSPLLAGHTETVLVADTGSLTGTHGTPGTVSKNEIADSACLLEIQVTYVAENGKDGEHKRKGSACRTQAEPYHMVNRILSYTY